MRAALTITLVSRRKISGLLAKIVARDKTPIWMKIENDEQRPAIKRTKNYVPNLITYRAYGSRIKFNKCGVTRSHEYEARNRQAVRKHTQSVLPIEAST